MDYKPEGHEERKKEKEAKKKRRDQKKKEQGKEGNSKEEPKQKFKLKETLKRVLMTNCAFSEEAADEIYNSTKDKLSKDF